jgi:hypothetical protein
MSDSNSVLTRVPPEIWRRILLEVMHVPYLLDTTCTGSLFELWNAIKSPRAHWRRSEWQRKLLRLVCKSWKHFAETKAYRSIDPQDWLQEPHIRAHARKAQLSQYWCQSHMFTVPTLWEVAEIYSDDLVDDFLDSIVRGCHPRLRRLSMQTRLSSFYVAYKSGAFSQLTFLHLNFDWHFGAESRPNTTTVIQTILPRLEVLIWEGIVAPTQIFQLPSLQHFGWRARNGHSPLSTLVSFAPTLRSLSIQNKYPRITLVLPDLNEFPLLEELSVSVDFTFEIQDLNPFPPTYPLHTIYLEWLYSSTIYSVMQILDCNPAKLRRIRSRRLKWGNGGEPDYVDSGEMVVRLADICQERRIRFEDSKGRVRSEMPPEVELRDFTLW